MEQQELQWREMKNNLSINQQEQQLGDVKIKKGNNASVGGEEFGLRTEHSCSEASEVAYGAAVYLVIWYQNGDVSSKLVAAKTKVAPMAAVSIPRHELMAAVLSLHLAKTVAEVYKIGPKNVNHWTDSFNIVVG